MRTLDEIKKAWFDARMEGKGWALSVSEFLELQNHVDRPHEKATLEYPMLSICDSEVNMPAFLPARFYRGKFSLRAIGASLPDVEFNECDLSNVDLSSIIANESSWHKCDLRWVRLNNANLVGCSITHCDLSGANFTGATLYDCDFAHNDLSGALGIWSCGAGGSRFDQLYVINGHDTPEGFMIKAGCFWGSLSEFVDKVALKAKGGTSRRYYEMVIIPALRALKESGFQFGHHPVLKHFEVRSTPE